MKGQRFKKIVQLGNDSLFLSANITAPAAVASLARTSLFARVFIILASVVRIVLFERYFYLAARSNAQDMFGHVFSVLILS